MICCQFVFEKDTYDDDFNRLDAEIDKFARALPGFVNVHTFYSSDSRITNAIYFFADVQSVRELAKYPAHLTAKEGVKRWYKGYQIVVSEVTSEYGDGNLIYP